MLYFKGWISGKTSLIIYGDIPMSTLNIYVAIRSHTTMTSTKKEDFYDAQPPLSAKMTNRRSGKHVENFKTPSQPPHVRT